MTALSGREVWIDGVNTIITLEVLLSDSILFSCMDGTIRDLAALRGTYRLIPETGAAIHMLFDLLREAEVIDFYFERLELSVSSVKAYIYYDQYYCDGTLDNMIGSLSKIKALVAEQYNENITHGVIYVGSGGYLSYAP